MKSIETKLLSSTVLPLLIGGGFVMGGALIAPQLVQAGAGSAGNLNPAAISRAQAGLMQLAASDNPCNPCNPCAAKNPCMPKHNPCNPCAAKKKHKMQNPCNPCAARNNPCNPFSVNPCAAGGIDPKLVMRPAGTSAYKGDMAALVREGKKLFMDEKLSTNGMSCQSCHADLEAFSETFAQPFPHKVGMAFDIGGVSSVSLEEMVQFCMVMPMEAKPLAWDSRELAALSAYTATLQKAFIAGGANPCNPCAAKKPINPCAARNPCNPCAAKNPCNPCNPCSPN